MEQQNTSTRFCLSLKLPGPLSQGLREFVERESCRSLQEVVSYFLEGMTAAIQRQQQFHLHAGNPQKAAMSGDFKGDIPMELHDSLVKVAEKYGMKFTEIVRIFLWMALAIHKETFPAGEIVSKEEFVQQLIAAFCPNKAA